MNPRLLETKLHTPAWRSRAVARPRLLERLRQGFSDAHKLTLISAPAGYGKTTLVTEWLVNQVQAAPCFKVAWLALDEADNDLARFLRYGLAALQRVDASLGQDLQRLLELPQIPPPASILNELINDLAALSYPVVWVLDDYHVIHSHAVHAALEFLLEHQPHTLHLVICTRQDPPFALAQLRVRSSITELRADDLRFTTEEATLFFAQTMNLPIADDALTMLAARTEGWIAGLQLAALSLQGEDSAIEFAQQFSGNHRYVIDYLVEQVLARQNAAVRAFLVRTAILDRMCGALCDAILQEAGLTIHSSAMLIYLEHANLFLIPLDSERHWYRYHQLFADSLRVELETEEQARLHRRAAEWFADHELINEAIQHAYRAQDFTLAAHLISQHTTRTLQRGEVVTLLDWLRLLPMHIVLADNTLVTAKAYTLFFTGQTAEAQKVVEAALDESSGMRDSVTRGRLLALRAWFPTLQSPVLTGELAQAALALIEPDDALSRSFALLPLGNAQKAKGDLVGATLTFGEAYRMGVQAKFPLAKMGALYNLAFSLNEQGRRGEAIALCEEALAACVDTRGHSLPLACLAYVPLATLHYAANELSLARAEAHKGLELSQQTISGVILGGDAEYILAQVHLALGEKEAALDLIRTVRATAQRAGITRVADSLWASEADLSLRLGEVAPALAWATSLGLTPDIMVTAVSGKYPLTYTRLLMAQGYLKDAQMVADRFEQYARRQGRQTWLITVLILQSLISLQLADAQKAKRLLTQAIALAAPQNYCRVFLDFGQALTYLLPEVHHSAPLFVDQLLAHFGASPGRSHWGSGPRDNPLVEALSERESEILRLIGEGLSNQEIAQHLVITVGTTKWHLNHIYAKLGVKGRTQALVRARALQML